MMRGWRYIFGLAFLMFFGLNLSAQVEKENVSFDSLEIVYEEMPQFPGGKDSMKDFITRNANYPEKYFDVQGTVFISVAIDSFGSISDWKILKGLDFKEFQDEALRIVSIMPNWIPAKINGKPVNSKIILPVIFRRE